MTRRLTTADATAEARRLVRAGFRPPETGPTAAAAVWVEVLYDVTPDDFREAVTRYIRGTNAFWPTPGHLLARVLEVRAETTIPLREPADPLAPCPICGAVLKELGPDVLGGNASRLGVLHDVAAHERAGVGWIGYPLVPPATPRSEPVGGPRRLRIERG